MVGLESDNYHNEYKMISNNPTYYEVKFSYEIPGLEEFDESLVSGVLKDYETKIKEISYDLLASRVLTELISNKDMDKYVIRIDKGLKKAGIALLIYAAIIVGLSEIGERPFLADPETGEVLVEKDNMITEDVAIAIQDTGINVVNVNVNVNGK